ncbi:hypothetical protein Droror1_Dr00024767 [Drosera rotundifolia]
MSKSKKMNNHSSILTSHCSLANHQTYPRQSCLLPPSRQITLLLLSLLLHIVVVEFVVVVVVVAGFGNWVRFGGLGMRWVGFLLECTAFIVSSKPSCTLPTPNTAHTSTSPTNFDPLNKTLKSPPTNPPLWKHESKKRH